MDKLIIYEKAYELAKVIKESEVFNSYKEYEKLVIENIEIQKLLSAFLKSKNKFEEASKYDKYYPGLEKIKKEYQEAKISLMNNEIFKTYKQKEKELDIILYKIENSLKETINIRDKHNKNILKFI